MCCCVIRMVDAAAAGVLYSACHSGGGETTLNPGGAGPGAVGRGRVGGARLVLGALRERAGGGAPPRVAGVADRTVGGGGDRARSRRRAGGRAGPHRRAGGRARPPRVDAGAASRDRARHGVGDRSGGTALDPAAAAAAAPRVGRGRAPPARGRGARARRGRVPRVGGRRLRPRLARRVGPRHPPLPGRGRRRRPRRRAAPRGPAAARGRRRRRHGRGDRAPGDRGAGGEDPGAARDAHRHVGAPERGDRDGGRRRRPGVRGARRGGVAGAAHPRLPPARPAARPARVGGRPDPAADASRPPRQRLLARRLFHAPRRHPLLPPGDDRGDVRPGGPGAARRRGAALPAPHQRPDRLPALRPRRRPRAARAARLRRHRGRCGEPADARAVGGHDRRARPVAHRAADVGERAGDGDGQLQLRPGLADAADGRAILRVRHRRVP